VNPAAPQPERSMDSATRSSGASPRGCYPSLGRANPAAPQPDDLWICDVVQGASPRGCYPSEGGDLGGLRREVATRPRILRRDPGGTHREVATRPWDSATRSTGASPRGCYPSLGDAIHGGFTERLLPVLGRHDRARSVQSMDSATRSRRASPRGCYPSLGGFHREVATRPWGATRPEASPRGCYPSSGLNSTCRRCTIHQWATYELCCICRTYISGTKIDIKIKRCRTSPIAAVMRFGGRARAEMLNPKLTA
jgi:hypothetical protein